MVYLFQFPRVYCVPSLSPFWLKLETFLRIANIDYENFNVPDNFSIRSREGTLPFIELDGVEYPDSALAIRDLIRIKNKSNLTAHLSDVDIALSRAVEKLCENSALLSAAHIRMTEHMDEIFSEKIIPINKMSLFTRIGLYLFVPMFKRGVIKKLRKTGIGKHSREDIVHMGCDDLAALSTILGDNKYFFGEKATATDAYVFALVAQILYIPVDTPHKTFILTKANNLQAHCDRVRKEFWPDWNLITEELQCHSNAWKKY